MSASLDVIPPRADLKVGFACNNRCLFCAQGDKRIECGSLPVEELLSRLQPLVGKADGVVLTGGEPTVYKHLAELVRKVRAMGFSSVQLQTNGRMLAYAEALAALVEAGVTEVSPSLHGSRAEIHEALTRAPGSFAQSAAGIKNAVRMGLPVVTNSVVAKANTNDLPLLVELLGRLGVRHAQLAYVHPVGTAFTLFDEVVPRLPDVVEPIRAARQVAARHGMRLVTEAVPLCFLRGMEDLAVEDHIPHTTVLDLDGKSADYSAWRVAEGKSHGPPCVACTARTRCEGPWREYPDRFGWDEFVTVTD